MSIKYSNSLTNFEDLINHLVDFTGLIVNNEEDDNNFNEDALNNNEIIINAEENFDTQIELFQEDDSYNEEISFPNAYLSENEEDECHSEETIDIIYEITPTGRIIHAGVRRTLEDNNNRPFALDDATEIDYNENVNNNSSISIIGDITVNNNN